MLKQYSIQYMNSNEGDKDPLSREYLSALFNRQITAPREIAGVSTPCWRVFFGHFVENAMYEAQCGAQRYHRAA